MRNSSPDTASPEIVQSFDVSYRYTVTFTRDVFAPANGILCDIFRRAGDGPHRVLFAVDSGVLAEHPDLAQRIDTYVDANADLLETANEIVTVPGGEVCKTDARHAAVLHDRIAGHRICRHSFVVAIGGGAVLDVVGFAASTAHRGVRLIRMPTTVLAQNDAGIGVKNAINLDGRKNFIGTFAPPFAVINDASFLDSLPSRELRAGIAEAVKVALIRDADFFDHLHSGRKRLAAFDPDAMEEMIRRCAELHLAHIRTSGDPFELGSARPLDFGHWSAHKLEEMSGGTLRHGEAVAVGIAIDSIYSHRVGRIREADLLAIIETLGDLGFELYPKQLGELDVERALSDFREHLGGALCITLLDGIGRGVEVDHVDLPTMQKSIEQIKDYAPGAS